MEKEATVVIVRHNEPLDVVKDCVGSICGQKGSKLSVLLLDQARGEDLSALAAQWPVERRRISDTSLSYCRNYALKEAPTDAILFVDCDAIAEPCWAERLLEALSLEHVAIAGSRVVLDWRTAAPWWAASEWVQEQYSRFDLGSESLDVEFIFGAGFGVRRSRLGTESFSLKLGRRNGALLGGEELQLCRAIRKRGGRVRYAGGSVVKHQVCSDRATLWWLMKRAYYGGYTRALLGGGPCAAAAKFSLVELPPVLLCSLPYAAGYTAAAMRLLETQDVCTNESR